MPQALRIRLCAVVIALASGAGLSAQSQYSQAPLPAGNNKTAPLNFPPGFAPPGYGTSPTNTAAQSAAPRTTAYPSESAPPGYRPGFAPPPPAFGTPSNFVQPVSAPARPPSDIFEPATLIGVVGNQHILAGDALPTVDQMLAPYIEQLNQEQDATRRAMMQDALDQQRRILMQRMLASIIENKLLYHEFLRSLPADKRDEAMSKLRKQLADEFDRSELPKAMERAKVETEAELDAKLREAGSSLARQKQSFLERQLGRASVGRSVNTSPEITHTEMLDYYHAHLADYAVPAKARWEQLTTLFERFPAKQQAYDALAQMGNEIYLGGAPFAAVAKRSSQSSNADSGGYFDWTSKGSLRSKQVDEAVFGLPLNQLSPIIEDDRGFHILRVLERTDATTIAFTDAQVEIKEKLRQEKLRAAINGYLEKIREDVYVWTVFDDDPQAETAARGDSAARN